MHQLRAARGLPRCSVRYDMVGLPCWSLQDALSVLDDGSPAGDKYARASFRLPVGFLEDAVQVGQHQ